MKQKLKLMPMLFTLIMMLVFVACGNKDISGNVTPPENQVDANDTTTAPSAQEKDTYEMGLLNGGVYTNDFLGIRCELDENWIYFDQEQIAEINGIVKDSLNDEDIVEMMENGKTVTDMYTASTDGLASINIVFENLGVVYGMSMDEDGYIDQSIELVKSSLEAAGIENVSVEKTTVTFAGADRAAISVTGVYTEIPIYEKLVCIKKGNYMAIITLCTYYEDATDGIAGLFSSLA